jgi:hypothetical protein
MRHSDFQLGMVFTCGDKRWRVTDIGRRVIVAIRIDQVEVVHGRDIGFGHLKDILSYEQAEKDGWFNGPPYAVAETVFDEDDFAGCEEEQCPRS